MEAAPSIRLVAGLGNPGKAYERTRHNIGFLVIDELCRRRALTLQPFPKWHCELASDMSGALMKPLTYMNRSGESIGAYLRFHKLGASDVLVVVDDTALPVGRLRLRSSGSSGGHNGLESAIAHLGSREFPRLRIGVGARDHASQSAHVLGKFREDEQPEIDAAVRRAADAVEWVQTHGLPSAMNQFNPNTNIP